MSDKKQAEPDGAEIPGHWATFTVEKKPYHLRLPHGETDGAKRYVMPDPDAGLDAIGRMTDYWSGLRGELHRGDLARVLMLARGYIALTTYPLGQEHCVGKLRDVWRARRARK